MSVEWRGGPVSFYEEVSLIICTYLLPEFLKPVLPNVKQRRTADHA